MRFAPPTAEEHAALDVELNPHGLTPTELMAYLERPDWRGCALENPEQVAAMRVKMAQWFDVSPFDRDRIDAYLARVWRLYGRPAGSDEQPQDRPSTNDPAASLPSRIRPVCGPRRC